MAAPGGPPRRGRSKDFLHLGRIWLDVGSRPRVAGRVGSSPDPFELRPPVHLDLHVNSTGTADIAELILGVERLGPGAIRFETDDYLTVFKAMQAAITLAGETLR